MNSVEEAPETIEVKVPDEKGGFTTLYKALPHQQLFHAAPEANVLALGTRGTGKSLQLRWDAIIRCLAFPNFKALILRTTVPELKRSHLMDIPREMKQLGGYYHHTDMKAVFPNGSIIQFGAVEDESAVLKYLSSQYDYIGFDELSLFSQDQFTKISASARSPKDAPYVALVRACSNPLGPGASWMRAFFVDHTVDYAQNPDYIPSDWRMIFSKLEDNPYLEAREYRSRLANLPEHVKRAWLHGEFVEEGQYFAEFQPNALVDGDIRQWHVIDQVPTVQGQPLLSQSWVHIYRAYDHGYDPDYAYCLWVAVIPNGTAYAFKEKAWLRATAAEIACDIVNESQGMRIVDTFCDPSVFVNSASTGSSVGDIIEQNGVPLTKSHNDRAAAGLAIHEYLNTRIGDGPKLQILREGCPKLIRTLPTMRMDPKEPMRIASGGEDHPTITLAYFCMGDVAVPSQLPVYSHRYLYERESSRYRLGSESARKRY